MTYTNTEAIYSINDIEEFITNETQQECEVRTATIHRELILFTGVCASHEISGYIETENNHATKVHVTWH